jgi:hypothetical protein
MAIELVPLCTLRLQLKPPIEVGGGPAGTRLIVEVASAQVKGDRLRGEMLGTAAADWVIVGPGARERLTSGRRFKLMTARLSSCSTTADWMHRGACSSR